MGRRTNGGLEVNFEVNSVATSDGSTTTNDQHLPPPPPPQVYQLKKAKIKELKALIMSKGRNKAKVKELKALLMSKGNNTSGKKYALLTNVKEVIGCEEKFTVGYSPEIVDATVVTYEGNQFKNDVPPIAWVVITVEHEGIVEDVTDDSFCTYQHGGCSSPR